jgi:hypothetical protein
MDKSSLNLLFEQIITLIAAIFMFIGAGGIILVITTSPIYPDRMMDFAYTFVYSYMLVLGILLYVYRNRILVKR